MSEKFRNIENLKSHKNQFRVRKSLRNDERCFNHYNSEILVLY